MGQGFDHSQLDGGRGDYAAGRPVRARPIHEGIGNALRTVFAEAELPMSASGATCEFERLLAKL